MTPRLATTLVIVLFLLLAGGAVGPYADYTAARGRLADLSGEQVALLEAVEELETERARLEDPRSLEEEARSALGLTRPGEIPYIVVNPPTEPPVQPPEPVEAETDAPLWQRMIDWVTRWRD